MIHSPISSMVASLTPGQCQDCRVTVEVIMKDIGKSTRTAGIILAMGSANKRRRIFANTMQRRLSLV